MLNKDTMFELIERGFKSDRLCLMPVNIDTKLIDSVGVPEKCYSACFLGRLSPSKGIFDLPKIWEGIPGILLIIGGGGFENDRVRLYQMCEGKNIFFSGYQEGVKKYKLMKSCKVFILPSYEEGLSLAVKEALACGLPVVAWDLPVYQSAYGNAIHTVPKGDIEAFRNKIKELL